MYTWTTQTLSPKDYFFQDSKSIYLRTIQNEIKPEYDLRHQTGAKSMIIALFGGWFPSNQNKRDVFRAGFTVFRVDLWWVTDPGICVGIREIICKCPGVSVITTIIMTITITNQSSQRSPDTTTIIIHNHHHNDHIIRNNKHIHEKKLF